MMDNATANKQIGRTASTIFRLRQLWVNKELTILDMMDEYKASKGIDELTPEQEQEVKDNEGVLFRGISKRYFKRDFTVADDVEVKGAELKDGLLTISLEKIVPESKKAKTINIK